MQITLYRADSKSTDSPVNRYAPCVVEGIFSVTLDNGGWTCYDNRGSSAQLVAGTEHEAIAEAIARYESRGWSRSRDGLEARAQLIADRRNGAICRSLRYLRKKHRHALHGLLLGEQGWQAKATVQQWIMGYSDPPTKMVAKIKSLSRR